MITLQTFKTKKTIELGEKIGRGGQAEIYKTSESVAKIYISPLTEKEIEKLKVMVDNPPDDPMKGKGYVSIAWPQDLLVDNNNKVVGFIMPQISNSQGLIQVYNPKKRIGKRINWYHLHIIAYNLASIVECVHKKNYVIGDIKPQNLLVNDRTIVSIVDTDSFQITNPNNEEVYFCPVITQEYAPPELLNAKEPPELLNAKDWKTRKRLPTEDCFGLAVIIHQLLFGYHPFTGFSKETDTANEIKSIPDRISQGDWIYARKAIPGELSMPLKIVHPKIEECFHNCFTVGHENYHLRPSATDWKNAISEAIADLKDCSAQPGAHVYAGSYESCYWCERNSKLGVDIFPTYNDSAQFTVAKLRKTEDKPIKRKTEEIKEYPPIDPRILAWVTTGIICLGGIPPVWNNIIVPIYNQIVNQE